MNDDDPEKGFPPDPSEARLLRSAATIEQSARALAETYKAYRESVQIFGDLVRGVIAEVHPNEPINAQALLDKLESSVERITKLHEDYGNRFEKIVGESKNAS